MSTTAEPPLRLLARIAAEAPDVGLRRSAADVLATLAAAPAHGRAAAAVSAAVDELVTAAVGDRGLRDPAWRIREAVDALRDLVAGEVRPRSLEGVDARAAHDVLVEELNADLLAQIRTIAAASSSDPTALVAGIVIELRRSMSRRGVDLWWREPRPDLDGRSPIDLLRDDHDLAAATLPPMAALGDARGLALDRNQVNPSILDVSDALSLKSEPARRDQEP